MFRPKPNGNVETPSKREPMLPKDDPCLHKFIACCFEPM